MTLITGTALSQAVMLAAVPILARMYFPADFGHFALYVGAMTLVSVVAMLKFENSIPLPKDMGEAWLIGQLCFLSATLITLALYGVLIGATYWSPDPVAATISSNRWIYLVPIAVMLSSGTTVLYNLEYRKQNYGRVSRFRLLNAAAICSTQIGWTWTGADANGLIAGHFLGTAITFFALAFATLRRDWPQIPRFRWPSVSGIFIKYQDLPKYTILSDMASQVLAQSPVFMLTSLVGAHAAGYYNLTQRVLGAPMNLIASSVSEVYKQRASREYSEQGHFSTTFSATFKTLLLISLPISVALLILAPSAVALGLGKEWIKVADYIQILIVMYQLKFLASPLSYSFYIAGKQRLDLMLHLSLLLVFGLGALLSTAIPPSETTLLTVFSALYSGLYAVYLRLSLQFSRGR